ncbi:MAG TPA: 3-keto-5-aminohexanoate cleavage protein [Parvularculaceae bacterium]|nr:3-keto-5-aminohexanoate cleavage protein [Amphiplicatus sp.]MCB9956664.1 3-keto-5-aminohexanoate cleavage protein [Caulobacterales bacterium]HPE29832.1 3-keto-5-aminohexanoate cleavage protein [Parvularculaceae bacterium]
MGIAHEGFSTAVLSVLMGRHVRGGLEDNLYLDHGVFAANGQLIERATRIVEDVGCAVATLDKTD